MNTHAEQELPLRLPDTPEVMIFSASRIGTWISCNRKAAWEYFAGYRGVESKAMALGTAVHAVLEAAVPSAVLGRAIEIDRTTDAGAIAAEIVPHIPSDALGSETTFESKIEVRGRHVWQGYVDLRSPGSVIDYKTTSDFKYMKDAETLATDPQAIIYAENEFIAAPRMAKVWLRWIYSRTRGAREARHVDLHLARAPTHAIFQVLESFADEMQAAADAAPTDVIALHKYILTIHGNEDKCNDYGGCPHKARCGIFFQDPNRPKDTHHMTPLQRLQAMTALNGGPANSPPPAPPPPAPGLPPPPPPVLQNVGSATQVPTPTPPSALFLRLAAEAGLTPPAITPSTPTQAAVEETVAAAEGINPPKRPRGRPKKDTIPAPEPFQPIDPVARAEELPAPVPAVVTNEQPVPAAPVSFVCSPGPVPGLQQATPTKKIETLCVGCMPVGHDFLSLDAVLADAREMVGPAAYFGGYGYKTNGMMIEAVTKILAAEGYIDVLVVVDPRLHEAALVLSHLRAMSSVVIEALR